MNTTKNRNELVSELRSGKYNQRQSYLKTVWADGEKHCPWGIACEIYHKHHPSTSRWIRHKMYNFVGFAIDGEYPDEEYCVPYTIVMDFFGIDTKLAYEMIEMNDRYVPFDMIADHIEKEYSKQ